MGSATRIQHAKLIQREVTRLLLAARESLLSDLADLARLLPSWEQRELELAERKHKEVTKMMDTEEVNIAQLCAQNIVLWNVFLEAFTRQESVHQHLARIHHQLRVSSILSSAWKNYNFDSINNHPFDSINNNEFYSINNLKFCSIKFFTLSEKKKFHTRYTFLF